MSESKGETGIGFLGMLGLLFIALKLTGYIDWSWWLVLLPLWGPVALLFAVLIGGWGFVMVVKYLRRRKRK